MARDRYMYRHEAEAWASSAIPYGSFCPFDTSTLCDTFSLSPLHEKNKLGLRGKSVENYRSVEGSLWSKSASPNRHMIRLLCLAKPRSSRVFPIAVSDIQCSPVSTHQRL